MARFEHSIDVNVPVRTAYNQWTQFEQFPIFMDGVEEIRQVTDTLMRWKVEIAGRTEEFDTKITEQSPDQRIAWTSIGGATHAGVVTFHALDDAHTRVMLQIDYEPEGVVENVGAALGIVKARMSGDMKRFKEFIESRGVETGAWRGEVRRDNT